MCPDKWDKCLIKKNNCNIAIINIKEEIKIYVSSFNLAATFFRKVNI